MADKRYAEHPAELDRAENTPVRPAPHHGSAPHRQPAGRKSARRSARRWRRFVLIYSLVILIAGAVGLGVFYKYLAAFEATRPDHVMDELMADMSEADWREAMLANPGLAVTEFEDAATILGDYFDASCQGGKFTYRESAGVSTAHAPVFTIKSGAADVARVYLEPTESAGFGLSHWRVGRIEGYVSEYSLRKVSVRIEALEGTDIALNGKVVDPSYIVEEGIACENLTPLESRYAQPPQRVVYQVDGLYGSILVTDSQSREAAPAQESSDTVLLYELDHEGPYSLHLTVPAQAEASVCGVPLGEAEIASRSGGILSGLEKYVGEGQGFVTYAVEGLFRQPEITVTPPAGYTLESNVDDGGAVSYTFAGDEALAADYQPVAEKFFDLYIEYGAGKDYAFLPLLNITLPGTDLYTYIQDSTAAMYWASATEVSYDKLVYDHFVSWGEDCFTCRVSYKASLSSQAWYESYDYDLENTYDLAFVRQGDNWLAAAMAIVEE